MGDNSRGKSFKFKLPQAEAEYIFPVLAKLHHPGDWTIEAQEREKGTGARRRDVQRVAELSVIILWETPDAGVQFLESSRASMVSN